MENNNMKNMNFMNNMNIMNNNMINFNNENNMNNKINSSNILQNTINNNIINSGASTEINLNNLVYPHKTGLQNIGAPSYMNSIIQCLSNIKCLSDYLIGHNGKFDIKNQALSAEFSNLVYDLFTTQKKYIVPELFKKSIGKLNPLFEGNHVSDAKDFLHFLLEKLHQELNKRNYSESSNIDYVKLEKDSFDENKMFQNFIKDYSEKTFSIISNNFYGVIRSTSKCNCCNKTKYSFQTFNYLIFKLKNVKEYIQKTRKNNNNYKINIYDAFDYDKKLEILDGENMCYCYCCKALKPYIGQHIIYSLPRVLIIVLDRGRNNQGFKEEFIFPKDLDLSIENYVKINCNTKFYLQSIITHLGESVVGGHFITYCRNGPNEEFLCYNDTFVLKVTVNKAMSSNIFGNEIERRTPYILVYHSIN